MYDDIVRNLTDAINCSRDEHYASARAHIAAALMWIDDCEAQKEIDDIADNVPVNTAL